MVWSTDLRSHAPHRRGLLTLNPAIFAIAWNERSAARRIALDPADVSG